MNKPFVSVIIPVLNDLERLQICLDALEKQTYPKILYEVIVVDNGSLEKINDTVCNFSKARMTNEKRPGSYAARNKGISIARGDVIAFTDSDCIPAPDWIEKGVNNLLSVSNCGLVGGNVKVFTKNPYNPTAVELFETVVAFPQKHNVHSKKYGATANAFTLRRVIEKVGVFDDKLKSGGDVEWGQRVFSNGYTLVYADDAFVAHPARYSVNELYIKHCRTVGGDYARVKTKSSYPLINILNSLVIGLMPPVITVFRICSDEKFKRLKGIKQKCKVILVFLFVRYVRVWERVRLLLGGKPKE